MIIITFNHTTRIIALFFITMISYGFFNAYLSITDPVESNYVLSAITMLKHNSWISPMIYDQVWYDKPPLTYWALMICYKVFGVSDFVSRIPSTVIAAASVSFIYHLVYKIKQSISVAIASALLLMTTLQFWYISHAIVTDGFLFFFSLAIFGYSYLAFANNDKRSILKAYIAAAFAVLAKGPIGLILPGFILILFVLARWFTHKSTTDSTLPKDIKLLFNPWGILLFTVIALPWYLAMYAIHGSEFINGFFGLHNVDRALVSEHPKFNVWYYYLIIVPLSLLPWTPAVFYRLKQINWKDDLDLLSIIWFTIIILFYSLVATKYLTYTFPAIIPCVIWGATAAVDILNNGSNRLKNIIVIPVIIFFILFTGASLYMPTLSATPMVIGLLLLAAVFIMYRSITKTRVNLTVLYSLALVILYAAITVTVPPVLMAQSGLQFKPYIEHSTQPIYIYGTYYTSIVYYTDITPTQVFVKTTDDPRWTKGKTLMPSITESEFLEALTNTQQGIIIVPNRYNKEFEASPASLYTKEIGKTENTKIYQLKETITF